MREQATIRDSSGSRRSGLSPQDYQTRTGFHARLSLQEVPLLARRPSNRRTVDGLMTSRLLDSSERIMDMVITVCAIAVCGFITADQLGALRWLGAG